MPFEVSNPDDILCWLRHEVELAHAESAEPQLRTSPQWREFKAEVASGDQIHYFRSPEDTWTGFPLCGVEGYVILRDSKVHSYFVTKFS